MFQKYNSMTKQEKEIKKALEETIISNIFES